MDMILDSRTWYFYILYENKKRTKIDISAFNEIVHDYSYKYKIFNHFTLIKKHEIEKMQLVRYYKTD